MADGLAGHQWFSLARKSPYGLKSLVHCGRRPRNRRPEIAKAALLDGNQVVASDRKPEAVTEALGTYL